MMLLNSGVGEDSWESLGWQGDPTSPFWKRSALGFLWKEWCWSWNSSTLATSCKELDTTDWLNWTDYKICECEIIFFINVYARDLRPGRIRKPVLISLSLFLFKILKISPEYGALKLNLLLKESSAKLEGIKGMCLISRWGRSPGGVHGNPFQYSYLENPMDRGTWQATIRRVSKSWTRLTN